MGKNLFTKDDFIIYCEYPIDNTDLPKVVYKIKYMGKKREKVISGTYATEVEARREVDKCVRFLNDYLEGRELNDESKKSS